MNLIEKLNKTKNESFEKWFERWYEKLNLEEKLIDSAKKGFNSYQISIKDEGDIESKFSKKEQYLVRRLRDPRTLKNIQSKLGEGFKIDHEEQTREGIIFGISIYRTSDWINIKWEERPK